MNNDREMFRRLVETARPAQAAHLDSLQKNTNNRAGTGFVPAAALLGMTALLVVATIAALSAARNFPPDNQVAQTDATATPLPAHTATAEHTPIPAGELTATAARRQATATPSIVPPTDRIAFPQHPQGSRDPSDQALIQGRLVERDGCLWIGDGLVIWPRDYSLDTSGERARVLNGEGRVAARVGDYVTGGGGVAEGKGAAPALREQGVDLPPRCLGPYLIMGGVRAVTGTPTTAPPDDLYLCITGTITKAEPVKNRSISIDVDEYPDDQSEGNRLHVAVSPSARVLEMTAGEPVRRPPADLRVGRRVAVTCRGPIATSYPGWAEAHEVAILRERTEGPSEGRSADTVTMTFQLSLFNLGGKVPSGDDFYVSYSIRGGRSGELHFCGDDPGAPERCRGSGGTYELAVEVPRGAELSYTVRREPAIGKAEELDVGREMMDLNLVAESHYRYGAANPDGF